LYYCTKAGLDFGDCEYGEAERFASIPEHERELAENLLFQHPPKQVPGGTFACGIVARNVPAGLARAEQEQRCGAEINFNIAAFGHFRTATKKERSARRIYRSTSGWNYIIQGNARRTCGDLEKKRAEGRPAEIINGPLMSAMSEVGRLFKCE